MKHWKKMFSMAQLWMSQTLLWKRLARKPIIFQFCNDRTKLWINVHYTQWMILRNPKFAKLNKCSNNNFVVVIVLKISKLFFRNEKLSTQNDWKTKVTDESLILKKWNPIKKYYSCFSAGGGPRKWFHGSLQKQWKYNSIKKTS